MQPNAIKLEASAFVLYAQIANILGHPPAPSRMRSLKNPFLTETRESTTRTAVSRFDASPFSVFEGDMFLAPIIIRELSKIKRWGTREVEFVAVLANAHKKTWKKTLSDLRKLERRPGDIIPKIISTWSTYGTLIGVQKLADPVVGCCYAQCTSFMTDSGRPVGRCTGCREVQYCTGSSGCQKR